MHCKAANILLSGSFRWPKLAKSNRIPIQISNVIGSLWFQDLLFLFFGTKRKVKHSTSQNRFSTIHFAICGSRQANVKPSSGISSIWPARQKDSFSLYAMEKRKNWTGRNEKFRRMKTRIAFTCRIQITENRDRLHLVRKTTWKRFLDYHTSNYISIRFRGVSLFSNAVWPCEAN